ncbi:MAG TPA: PAS domain-containing protein [Steroidobacteraceae bacterium]|nr:PAS domain-containing protein [Steroidobacteraceae bacterium]
MPHKGLTLGTHAAPARLAATVTTLIGLAALAGWVFHLPALTRMLPGSSAMTGNTSIGLILCGASLLILADRVPSRLERLAQSFALAAMIIGAATLAEYVFSMQLGVDELLIKDYAAGAILFPGRMSPFSATAFIVLGFALAAMRRKSLGWAAQSAAAVVIVIGVVTIAGYLWNAGISVRDPQLPPIAVNTAACFAMLGVGILLSPSGPGVGFDTQITALATVEVKILAGFLLAMSLLLFGGSYTYRTSVEFAASVDWISHTQEVRKSLADVYGAFAGAELAQRDFLLTGSQSRRDDYLRVARISQDHLAELERLIGDKPEQQANLADLKSAIAGRFDYLASVAAAYQNYGLPAAQAVLGEARPNSNVRSVRLAVERLDAVEVRLLSARQAESAHVRRTTFASLLITLGCASALFTALFRGIHREMLARRDAERALRASDRYNRSIVDSSPDCLAILTPEARLSQMTPQGMRLLDVEDFASIANRDWFAFWSGEDQAAARSAVAAALAGSAGRFQGRCPTQAGVPKWWDVIVMPIKGADGKTEQLLSVARDISEVKTAESNLLASNRFLDSLIENVPLMIFVKDAKDLRFVRLNRAGEALLGISRDALIGKSDRDFFPPDEAEHFMARDHEAIASGRVVDISEEAIHTRLLGIRTLHTMKMPILDANGEPQFLLGISVDITERKRAEHAVRELNEELHGKAAQLEATVKELESFSYSVSHDLRAPLRAVDGFALMLEEDYHERIDAEGRRYLSVIRENSRRMGVLIDDLLAFSRLGRQPVAAREVNIDSLVREVVAEALDANALGKIDHPECAPQIEVGSLPPARGDAGLLRQVWANLISNAIKYSSKMPRPRIEVSGCELGSENQYSVRDNGVGFNMDYADKLFGVFQRLHRADEFRGTGVGLAIVHRVITRHGGRVWAEGKVNHGAVFSFALPRGERNG